MSKAAEDRQPFFLRCWCPQFVWAPRFRRLSEPVSLSGKATLALSHRICPGASQAMFLCRVPIVSSGEAAASHSPERKLGDGWQIAHQSREAATSEDESHRSFWSMSRLQCVGDENPKRAFGAMRCRAEQLAPKTLHGVEALPPQGFFSGPTHYGTTGFAVTSPSFSVTGYTAS